MNVESEQHYQVKRRRFFNRAPLGRVGFALVLWSSGGELEEIHVDRKEWRDKTRILPLISNGGIARSWGYDQLEQMVKDPASLLEATGLLLAALLSFSHGSKQHSFAEWSVKRSVNVK